MKKTLNLKKASHMSALLGGGVAAVLVLSIFGIQSAYAAITSQLDLGDTGSEVTELQSYLATNASIYPSGLVTGYFGLLTQGGVQKFQAAQGIVSSGSPATTGYGRVGPQTMLRINSLMGSGQAWDTSPILSNLSVQHTNTTVTFSWTTNEPTQGQVYWDTASIRTDEATGPNQQPYVSGTLALDAGGSQTNHTVTVSNLQASKTYYYVVRSVDSVGNMSMIWPSSVQTSQ